MIPVKPLLLGSTSQSRQSILTFGRIPFTLLKQQADETKCDWTVSLRGIVESIASYKMEQLIMPEREKGTVEYVLTADTLSSNGRGTICGKPKDEADAIAMITLGREGKMKTGTAFCLEKRVSLGNGGWETVERILNYAEGEYIFNVPDEWVASYLRYSIAYSAASAIGIESYGNMFLERVEGSYTAIRGLPLYEVRVALQQLGYFI
ncbi:MAG: Maf family protein [Candidatus Babeliales bacterium]